eukprot:2871324-Prymnesium_polylepis.1
MLLLLALLPPAAAVAQEPVAADRRATGSSCLIGGEGLPCSGSGSAALVGVLLLPNKPMVAAAPQTLATPRLGTRP